MSTSTSGRAWCAALLAAATVAACSSGGSGKAGSSTTTRPTDARVKVTPLLVTVASAGPPAQLPDADKAAVFAAVGSYVQDASVDPLEGKATPDLASHFAAAAAPALQGTERDALTDTDVPRSTGRVTATLKPVNLHALADSTGAIDLVGATLDLTVQAPAAKGPITIHRTGELMFTRDAGTWKILSFKLAVTRDGAGLGAETSTTTKAAP
jgi:hypothetical protein